MQYIYLKWKPFTWALDTFIIFQIIYIVHLRTVWQCLSNLLEFSNQLTYTKCTRKGLTWSCMFSTSIFHLLYLGRTHIKKIILVLFSKIFEACLVDLPKKIFKREFMKTLRSGRQIKKKYLEIINWHIEEVIKRFFLTF